MPFKVVQTIEDGKICLSVVPSNWEINGTLWWPPTPLTNVATKEHSKPKATWHQYGCVVKRIFAKYESAIQEQKIMEGRADTGEEDEEAAVESLFTSARQELPPPPAIQYSYNPTLTHRNAQPKQPSLKTYDFNNLIVLSDKVPPPSASNDDNLIGHNISLGDVNIDHSFLMTSQNETILQNQKQIIENTQKILSQQARHEVIFEELFNKISKMEQNQASFVPSNAQNNVFFERFPAVKSVNELQELEDKLKEPSFRRRYIDCMSVLCSEGTGLRGNNLCYKMVDFFMSRDVFLECSWTGNTRDDLKTEKKPFKFFENVRATFLSVIRTTDINFSQLQCDEFFKKIIKNSKQRFESATKPISTSTPKRNSKKRARTDPPQEEIEIKQKEEIRKFGHLEFRQLQEEREVRQPQKDKVVGQLQEDGGLGSFRGIGRVDSLRKKGRLDSLAKIGRLNSLKKIGRLHSFKEKGRLDRIRKKGSWKKWRMVRLKEKGKWDSLKKFWRPECLMEILKTVLSLSMSRDQCPPKTYLTYWGQNT